MFESIQKFWTESMELPGANWIVGIFGLIVCVLVAYYCVKLFRDMATGQRSDSISHLAEFQQLHEDGLLADDEYKKLKSAIPGNINASVIPAPKTPVPKTLAEAEKEKAQNKNPPANPGDDSQTTDVVDFQELDETDETDRPD